MTKLILFAVGILTGRYIIELLDMGINILNANLQKYITKINRDIHNISQEVEEPEQTFAMGFQDTSDDYYDEEDFYEEEDEFEYDED